MTQDLLFQAIGNDLEDVKPSHAALLDSILKTVARLLQENGVTVSVDTVVAAAKQAYDKYVAPLDVPGIPNFVEPAFDAAVWMACEQGIRAIYARMVK